MDASLKKKLIFGLVLGFLVYVAFAFVADMQKILEAGSAFAWQIFPVVCLLSIGNYVVRLIRWNYYLGRLGVELEGRKSALVFFAGLVMSITPASSASCSRANTSRTSTAHRAAAPHR